MNVTNPKFHKDGTVSVNGTTVGCWVSPDKSGAGWATARRYQFRSADGRTDLAAKRSWLADYAISAFVRAQVAA